MLDFHSHILPMMDDGSKSIEQSVKMLKMSYQQGVSHLVLSPHFYPEREKPEDFFHRRNDCLRNFAKHIDFSDRPKLFVGAEVAYYQGMSHSDIIDRLSIVGTNYIMIEMPFMEWNERIVQDIINIGTQHNLYPILAHIDRYYKGNMKYLKDMYQHGVMFQVNAEAFEHFSTRRAMLKLINDDMVQFLGSDCHNTENRKPNMKSAYDCIVGKFGEEKIDFIDSNGRFALKKAKRL